MSRQFRKNIPNMFKWGWQASITGTSYSDLVLFRRRRHEIAFNVGKALGKRWSS